MTKIDMAEKPIISKPTQKRRLSFEEQKLIARQSRQRMMVGIAGCLAIIALSISIFSMWPHDNAINPIDDVPMPPARAGKLQAASRVIESKFPRAATAKQLSLPPRDDSAELARLMKSLMVNGRGPKFIPVSSLTLSNDGSPLRCYCLLNSPLDVETVKLWDKAGLLKNENELPSPYLRFVSIENESMMALLRDPRVRSVALSLNPE